MKDENEIDPTFAASDKATKEAQRIVKWILVPAIVACLLLASVWFGRLIWLLFLK